MLDGLNEEDIKILGVFVIFCKQYLVEVGCVLNSLFFELNIFFYNKVGYLWGIQFYVIVLSNVRNFLLRKLMNYVNYNYVYYNVIDQWILIEGLYQEDFNCFFNQLGYVSCVFRKLWCDRNSVGMIV